MQVLGLMSGTSADGIDVALVRIAGAPPRIQAELKDFVAFPFPRDIRAAVLGVAEGAPTTAGEISRLNFRLGELFGQAVLKACRKFAVSSRRIALIGSHGQTIHHQGAASRYLGARIASTLQIGEPSVIAARTGITTVGDFRPADLAVRGQGAPLVPLVDYLLYRDRKRGRAALNLGGIANVTVIPRAGRPEEVFAFDTGPGNMVMDALVKRLTRGKQSYDGDAKIARSGRGLPGLLNALLRDPYLRQRPPKSAGREQYGAAFVEKLIAMGTKEKGRPADLVRTATLFTALSVVDAMHRWVLSKTRIHQLIVSGGGAHNPLVMAQIAAALPGIEVLPSSAFGVPEDAKEAFAFAVLAYETFNRRPANLPSATGARRPAILGKICYAPAN